MNDGKAGEITNKKQKQRRADNISIFLRNAVDRS